MNSAFVQVLTAIAMVLTIVVIPSKVSTTKIVTKNLWQPM